MGDDNATNDIDKDVIRWRHYNNYAYDGDGENRQRNCCTCDYDICWYPWPLSKVAVIENEQDIILLRLAAHSKLLSIQILRRDNPPKLALLVLRDYVVHLSGRHLDLNGGKQSSTKPGFAPEGGS